MKGPFPVDHPPRPARPALRFGAGEWSGACGDLGTLLPYLVAYLLVLKLEPAGVLCGFGLALVATGLLFRSPLPVQPMKAIGALAVAQGATAGAIATAGLLTGLAWLLLSASGWARRLARAVSTPVVDGLVLGLALSLLWQAAGLMQQQPLAGLVALVALGPTWFQRRLGARWQGLAVAALPVLLLVSAAWALWRQPSALQGWEALKPAWTLPTWAWPPLASADLFWAGLLLALPQMPLTAGNALLAVHAEHRRLFPDRPLSETRLALSTGAINTLGSTMGAVPMCHGVGGLAAQVHFGARTGGAPVILGLLLLVAGLAWADAATALLGLLPPAVLGATLALAAGSLARGVLQPGTKRSHTGLMLTVAVLSVWHAAAGLLVGLLLQRWWRARSGA